MNSRSNLVQPAQPGDMPKTLVSDTGLPPDLKASEPLTLDQIDARNVKILMDIKKGHKNPRVKITNRAITILANRNEAIVPIKIMLALAVEARRRLRHPNNQSYPTPFKGPAYGALEDWKEAGVVLTVTIGGQQVTVVKRSDMLPEEKDAETKPEAGQLVVLAR